MNVMIRLGLRSVFWRAMERRGQAVALPDSGERVGHSQTGEQVSDLAASQTMVGVRQHCSDFPQHAVGPSRLTAPGVPVG